MITLRNEQEILTVRKMRKNKCFKWRVAHNCVVLSTMFIPDSSFGLYWVCILQPRT